MKLVFALLAMRLLAADAPIFSWVDGQGVLHATDRLGDVPEPYYSMYSARLKELEERQKHAPPQPEPPPAPPPSSRPTVPGGGIPTTQDEALRREGWKQTMRQWRGELANATAELQKAEQKVAEARMNPVLALTPAVREQVEELSLTRNRARDRVMAARNMLLEVLPKRARDEHVPPLWLM